MTFAAINWLSISINLLLILFVVVCFLMTLIILMQRPKQEGLGAAFGGGVTDQVFGARTTNVLQKATIYLGSAFFLLSLLLAIMVGQQNKVQSTVSSKEIVVKPEQEKAEEERITETLKKSIEKSLATELPAETPAPIIVPEVPTEVTPVIPVEPTPETPPAVTPIPADK
jgi:preprotein translocase subunit SecG